MSLTPFQLHHLFQKKSLTSGLKSMLKLHMHHNKLLHNINNHNSNTNNHNITNNPTTIFNNNNNNNITPRIIKWILIKIFIHEITKINFNVIKLRSRGNKESKSCWFFINFKFLLFYFCYKIKTFSLKICNKIISLALKNHHQT